MTELRLETPRLILRRRTLADFPPYHAMWAEPAVTEHFVNFAATREANWQRFGRCEGLWALMGYGPFTVIEKSSGDFVGDIGPADYTRDIDPPLEGAIEFGWALASRHFGKGYATEALRAAMKRTDETLGRRRFVAIIAPRNTPSFAVAERCGFGHAGQVALGGRMTELYSREV
jgi:RimJ/RimL family protein N-acetyltransferase